VEDAGRRRGGRQCGLCSLVARAFRRAVCGAPSRRGSGESYQELTAPLAEEEKVSTYTQLFRNLSVRQVHHFRIHYYTMR
jgi:hypothetical protein